MKIQKSWQVTDLTTDLPVKSFYEDYLAGNYANYLNDKNQRECGPSGRYRYAVERYYE